MEPKEPQMSRQDRDRKSMGVNARAMRANANLKNNKHKEENTREALTAVHHIENNSVKFAEGEASRGNYTEVSGDALARARAGKDPKIIEKD